MFHYIRKQKNVESKKYFYCIPHKRFMKTFSRRRLPDPFVITTQTKQTPWQPGNTVEDGQRSANNCRTRLTQATVTTLNCCAID